MERNTPHNFLGFPARERLYLLFYVLFLYGISAFYFFQWPIVAGDTDLWYHLNGGRYIAEHLALPTDSSFISFIAPPRVWVDYYWLFQVLVYRLHAALGYPGLMGLRNGVYLALVTVILAYFYLTHKRDVNRSPFYLAALFGLYMLFLLSRFLLVRPHMFSYLLIPVFLLIYEYAPRRAWWLPLLAVLWVNLHGAEYPVMLLIGGAYLFEWFVNRLRGHQKTAKADLAFLIPAALSMWAALATPHGSKLLTVPFATANASQYIVEYMPLMSQGFVTLHSVPLPSQRTLFTILLAAAWIGAVMSGYRKKLRVSHLLLLAGGTVLLVKGFRFMYECSLLALPILATNSLIRTSSSNSSIPKLPALPFCAVLVAAPLWWLHASLGNPPRFPVRSV